MNNPCRLNSETGRVHTNKYKVDYATNTLTKLENLITRQISWKETNQMTIQNQSQYL